MNESYKQITFKCLHYKLVTKSEGTLFYMQFSYRCNFQKRKLQSTKSDRSSQIVLRKQKFLVFKACLRSGTQQHKRFNKNSKVRPHLAMKPQSPKLCFSKQVKTRVLSHEECAFETWILYNGIVNEATSRYFVRFKAVCYCCVLLSLIVYQVFEALRSTVFYIFRSLVLIKVVNNSIQFSSYVSKLHKSVFFYVNYSIITRCFLTSDLILFNNNFFLSMYGTHFLYLFSSASRA